ncbi:2-C-methyl-D-erythritol 4-phosphate cytidylyltransferase [Stackebrandtia endophytica]|uniref:2-C-methyl-D-erythritol 4-phosphate cytidylyltransferase n=1 Tax=Stackebrandtia endophytica TaxID=1496996 RepID=A0A543AZP3_9ACTN|nr:2-C-methyl-D-erythritol 4-phosphate cytidylyltransferase [Stackebrandtia endophytica]TQL78039.1 2-C-methyl-D-erythritol 4-phosphate cytidylyltransferase [Stackebrandtia endophytica]
MTTSAIAVLLAGGIGSRMGADQPKQFLRVAGRELLAHTVDVFEACDRVDQIRLYLPATHRSAATDLVDRYGYRKVTVIGEGGTDRAGSVRCALADLVDQPDDRKILVHDAVRPLVDVATVTECVNLLDRVSALTVAVPSTDTILDVDSGSSLPTVSGIPDRSRMWRCQTPQGFRLGVLARAHRAAAADPDFTPTDDGGVVRRYLPEVPIAVVDGGELNIKVTHPVDLRLAESLLRDRTL